MGSLLPSVAHAALKAHSRGTIVAPTDQVLAPLAARLDSPSLLRALLRLKGGN